MTTLSLPTSTSDRAAVHRRTLRVLVLSQIFGGAGLAAGVTVGALLAQDMLSSTRFSGLPAALFTLGSAAASLLVGAVSQRHGRRRGLAVGYLAGAAGAAGVVLAAVLDSVVLLLAGLLVYGAGTATNLLARYAGGDLAPAASRGASVSTVLVATTVGAVAAPNLVGSTGHLAEGLGIPALAGPFALAAAAYAAAGLVLVTRLRPDPLLTARAWAESDGTSATAASTGEPSAEESSAVGLGALTMIVTQFVMAAVMTMTPVHMDHHGHGLGATGLVIGVHIGLMYLPSPLTGRLVDRYGSRPGIAAAGVVLLAAGLVAGTAAGDSVAAMAVALGLLGLGWNLGLLAGTTLVAGAVPLDRRARTQGRVDVAVALAGATGGLVSGVVVASTSFGVLAVGCGCLALGALAVGLGPRSAVAPG